MGKFAASMSARQIAGLKVDNHAERAHAKVALRRRVLAAIGGPQARVFDAFAGSGAMYRAAWKDAAAYTGCDLRQFGGGRLAYVADNLRVLRAVDLSAFNVFDLDAYGSPWKQATVIAARRDLAPGERIALVLTDGAPMRARLGQIEAGLAALAGVEPKLTGTSLRWRELTARALETAAARMGGTVSDFWAADTGSRPILYSAALIEGRQVGERGLTGAQAE